MQIIRHEIVDTSIITEFGIEALRDFKLKYGLREDWHEPDEQEVYAHVVGNSLDNAFGDVPAISLDWQTGIPGIYELIVIVQHRFYHDDGSHSVDEQVFVNLADLLAVATQS